MKRLIQLCLILIVLLGVVLLVLPPQSNPVSYVMRLSIPGGLFPKRPGTQFLAWPDQFTGRWCDYYYNLRQASEIDLVSGEYEIGDKLNYSKEGILLSRESSKYVELNPTLAASVKEAGINIAGNHVVWTDVFYWDKSGKEVGIGVIINDKPWSGHVAGYLSEKGVIAAGDYNDGKLVSHVP